MTQYTERDRDSLISVIFTHTKELEALSSPIIKAELSNLPEALAAVEKSATSFITKLRMYKRSEADPQD